MGDGYEKQVPIRLLRCAQSLRAGSHRCCATVRNDIVEKLKVDEMTTEQTLDEILNLAAAHFKVPREKLQADDDFFKTLGIDSLQTLDLLTKLENHFHVELPDYELQGVSDFRTLAARIQSRL
jgi:acyl carrier protein